MNLQAVAITAWALLALGATPSSGAAPVAPFNPPSEAMLPSDVRGETIRYGQRIVTQTGVFAKPYVGNALSCTNCHLEAGRKPKAAPYVGVYASFPQYRARSGKVDRIEDRINDCFQRSLNGKALPYESREMTALVAYMAWLSEGVPTGMKVEGQGFSRISPSAPPDAKRGSQVYGTSCAQCHGPDGQGTAAFPPLWGERSFNIGAGMARLDTAAAFIKWNMPLGQGGTLSDQQAYDVAAYLLSQPRPDFGPKVHDWPKGGKPKDSPY
ncbi:c-type cytochrome [bacterium]|nr:c-type cytochrome [bacterium]